MERRLRCANLAAMSAPSASKTAVAVLTLRAVHQLLDGTPKILTDPVAPLLLSEAERAALDSPERFATPIAIGLRSHVVARSRYAEECLQDAVARGVEQLVVLGAGLDSFAHRQPAWARTLRIFEVDHPASQADKRARLERAGLSSPDNLTWAPIDFERTRLGEGLASAGFAAERPTFFTCLGVLVYLTQDAIDELFGFVATLPKGSEIAFTISGNYQELTTSKQLASAAAAGGEPWLSVLTAEQVVPKLLALGFSEASVESEDAIARRYFEGRTDGLTAPRHARIGRAVV
jgi:methyltransferase (TIGR00027 family)